jgi:dihydroorotate dehydrogenase
MVYDGPRIAWRIAQGIAERARQAGFANIAEAVGSEQV